MRDERTNKEKAMTRKRDHYFPTTRNAVALAAIDAVRSKFSVNLEIDWQDENYCKLVVKSKVMGLDRYISIKAFIEGIEFGMLIA